MLSIWRLNQCILSVQLNEQMYEALSSSVSLKSIRPLILKKLLAANLCCGFEYQQAIIDRELSFSGTLDA